MIKITLIMAIIGVALFVGLRIYNAVLPIDKHVEHKFFPGKLYTNVMAAIGAFWIATIAMCFVTAIKVVWGLF